MTGGEGSTFGKYFLLRKIAAGGMGEIYLAKLKGPVGFEKLLVIKRILAHHVENQEFVDMFFAEARIAAQLNHSNIVQIYEMGEIDDAYFIAMEYIAGRPLRGVIDQVKDGTSKLHPAHVAEIIIKVCEGMSFAHNATDMMGESLGIIHRDINPHNLLVSYAGDVKIIDFGIAKSEMSMHKTETGTIKGKFVYMSPEQSAAEHLDKRSDIFPIGICLYEALAGFNPFAKANIVLSLDAIQRHDPPPVSTINPLWAPFDPIISKALAKKPVDRYADCLNLRDDLQALLASGAISTAPQSLSEFMRQVFAAYIEEEKRLIVESDNVSTTQIEAMRKATRTDHSSGSYRRALPRKAGVVEEGSTEIGYVLADEDVEAPTLVASHGELPRPLQGVRGVAVEERSRLPFFLILASIILATGAAAAAVVKLFGRAPQSTGPMVVEIDTQGDAELASLQADTDAQLDDRVNAPESSNGENRGDELDTNPGSDARPDQPKTNRDTDDRRRRRYERTPKPNPRPPSPPPRPITRAPTPPPPSPVPAGLGTLYVSVNPPVPIMLGNRPTAQTVRLKTSAGTLVLGSGENPVSDPFEIRMRYRVEGGAISFTLDSTPWAIVTDKSGVGLGKTPLPPTRADGSAVFTFKHPKENRQQRVTVRYAAP